MRREEEKKLTLGESIGLPEGCGEGEGLPILWQCHGIDCGEDKVFKFCPSLGSTHVLAHLSSSPFCACPDHSTNRIS